MTDAELAAFVAAARTQASAALALLDSVDPNALPPELRSAYDAQRAGWLEVLALTDSEAVELHLRAVEHAGRDLTDGEVQGLVRRQ